MLSHFFNRGARSLNLADAVDVAALQRIQDTFSKAMGFGAVIVDRTGIPVTRDSGFVPLCRLIRETNVGLRRCMECDAEGGLEARARRGPYSYVCKGGLIDIAAPIIIEEEYLGCILCGQVVPAGQRDEFIAGIMERNAGLGIPSRTLQAAALETPSAPRERIDAAAEMLFQVANYIVEMGVANLTQTALLEETKRAAALQAALQESQLRTLESQINPHFLFNALGLISYTALRENAHQTEDISYCLTDLLRYSLRNLATPVTLGQEVEAVQRYLSIQKLRFGARVSVEVDVDPTLEDVRIPCMLLQPLVENAIVHAVEPLARPVTVAVRARRGAEDVVLEVSDNGAGMETDTLHAIQVRHFDFPRGHAVGLTNVIRRLELEYGERSSIQVESARGRGTRVTIRLPLEQPQAAEPGSEE